MSSHLALVLCVFAAAVLDVQCEIGSRLVLVFAVNRHGARNVLPKGSSLQDAPVRPRGEVTLLPVGQRQCYTAGADFRRRYLNATTCGTLGGLLTEPNNTCLSPAESPGALGAEPKYGLVSDPDVTYSNYNTIVVSSALDRTLLSARSFITGVFPDVNTPTPTTFIPDGAQPVPIYSSAGSDADDILIRSYTKCPVYEKRLSQWYYSPQFNAKGAETAAFRAFVGSLAGWPVGVSNDTSLRNWYNVYDQFNVNIKTGYGDPMPAVNSTVYSQIVAVANWLETAKMASNLTGSLLSAPILAELSSRRVGCRPFPRLRNDVLKSPLAALAGGMTVGRR